MTAGTDYRVRDLGQMVLTLRPDLVFTPRFDCEEPGYLLEDRVSSKFFRIGAPEHTFISLLNGKTSVREALAVTAGAEPEHALTEEQAAAICQWLVENDLALTNEADALERPGASASRRPGAGSSAAKWNPLFLRIPLFHPDRFFQRLAPWANWLVSGPMALATGLLACVALYQVLTQWGQFVASSRGVLAPERWLWISAIWLLLKVVHELAHGVACKRYGGAIREAGVVFILAAPVAYVDITSTWRIRSKWQRMHTASAGILVELLAAAVAAVAWSRTPQGLGRDLCQQVVLMAGVTTLLFNANPLMRFDGYYIFSDLLEIPNLYVRGQQFLRHFARRHLFGLASELHDWSWPRGPWIAAYGVAALLWRITVYVGLLVAASAMFRGAGVVVAVVALVHWIGPAAFSLAKYVACGNGWEQPRRLRFLLTTGGILAALVLGAAILPWPGAYRAPAMVQYAPLAIVRAASPGFVREIFVHSGQTVRKGQPLVVLANEQLGLEWSDLTLAVQQTRHGLRARLYDGETAAYQAGKKELESLQHRLREKTDEFDALVLRAPIDGAVLARDLGALRGRYLDRGDELLAIGSEDRKTLKISIAEQDVDVFIAAQGQDVRARIRGAERFVSPLEEVKPRASLQPPDESLCAALGGPLAVRPVDVSKSLEDSPRYELLTPRFEGSVALNGPRSLSLKAGQRGSVALNAADRSIARHLASRVRHWAQNVAAARGGG